MQLILILISVLFALPDEAVLTSSVGEQIRGQLTEIRKASVVIRRTSSNQEQVFEFDKVAKIEFNHLIVATLGGGQGCKVRMIDDSSLLATSVTIENGVASLRLANELEMQIENRNLANILFNYQADDERADQWRQLGKSELASGDELVIQRNGKLTSLEGVVGDISAEKVNFKMDGQSAGISREKIEGVVFYHATGRTLAKPVCQITLSDLSTLMVRMIKLEADDMRCTLVSGTIVSLPIELVSELDFSLGRAVLLGNLIPTSRDWKPLIASSAILEKLRSLKLPRANRSYDNRKLELRVDSNDQFSPKELRSFESGYAMVGGSKLAFSLDGQYERLTGIVGFAPRSSDEGDLNLIIRGDKGILFSRRMQKRTLSGPIEIDLNIKNLDRLVIEVDYYDGRAIGDLIHLCDLKVSR